MPDRREKADPPAHQKPYPHSLLDHLSRAIDAHVELAEPPTAAEPDPEPIDLPERGHYE